MKSVAAVYARLDRAARGVADGNLSAWMGRRTGNAVQEAIRHGLSMAHDPDYRLAVEADRFARREYAATFDGFMGLGRTGAKYRALIEGAMLLRAGRGSEVGGVAIRREVERLRAEMRAEIDALRAPAPREYRYGAQNRPPGYGATPKDILRVDPPIPGIPQTRHGVVVYARPLTDEEVRGYELAPYVPLADIVARLMERVDRYGAQYADRLRKGDTATLRSGLGSTIDAEPFYTDIPHGDLWGQVADALLAKYPAATVAPAPVTSFPVRGFAGSTLDAEADGLRDFPDEDDGDEDNAAIRAVVRAYEAGKRKALVVSRAEADAVIAGLTVLANSEDERAEAERKRPVSKRDPESARMTRAASDGLSALSTRIFTAFKRSVS